MNLINGLSSSLVVFVALTLLFCDNCKGFLSFCEYSLFFFVILAFNLVMDRPHRLLLGIILMFQFEAKAIYDFNKSAFFLLAFYCGVILATTLS